MAIASTKFSQKPTVFWDGPEDLLNLLLDEVCTLDSSTTIPDLPNSVLKGGKPTIRAFFKAIKEGGGVDPTKKLTVFVMGQADAGKTSLIRSIKEDFKGRMVPEGRNRATIGIDVHTLDNATELGRPTSLQVMDFGGQEEYLAMHSVFFRRDGLAVIVFDLSLPPEVAASQASSYLVQLNTAFPGIHFILVGTKKDLVVETPRSITYCSAVLY